jgi:anti-anti-sigma factor
VSSAPLTVTLHPTGALDLARAPAFAVDAAQEIREGRAVIVDLSGVCFIDSTGVAMLLNALRRATRAGVGFAVICPDGQPRRTIETLRMLDALNVGADEAEAVTRMRRRDVGHAGVGGSSPDGSYAPRRSTPCTLQ